MAHPYTADPDQPFVEGAQLPDDGIDKVKAADINPVLAALLDNDGYLRQHTLLDETAADELHPALPFGSSANHQTFRLVGKLILQGGEDEPAEIEIGANSVITVKADGSVVVKNGATAWFEAGSAIALADGAGIIAEPGAEVQGPLAFADAVEMPNGVTGPFPCDDLITAASFGFQPTVSLTRTGTAQPVAQSGSWAVNSSTGQWTDAGTDGVLKIPVELPHNATLNTVTVWIDPDDGARAGVSNPSIGFYKRVLSTNSASQPTQTGGTETSANLTAYRACHALTLTLTGGHTIDRSTSVYYVVLNGETNGNKLAGLVYVGIEYTYTVFAVGRD